MKRAVKRFETEDGELIYIVLDKIVMIKHRPSTRMNLADILLQGEASFVTVCCRASDVAECLEAERI